MAKKKKKQRNLGSQFATTASNKFKNNVFAKLKLNSDIADTKDEQKLPQQHSCQDIEKTEQSDGDANVISEMTNGVSPLEKGAVLADKTVNINAVLFEMDDSELVMRHLDELVRGNSDFDIAGTSEYIEAFVKGLDRRIVKRLKKGEYPIQANIDLHGYRKDEARVYVADFIEKSHLNGLRCVLIVHGRGLGSKDNIPVLKEKLISWLTRGAMSKKVLAFTSARPVDGGTGAIYVLLRS